MDILRSRLYCIEVKASGDAKTFEDCVAILEAEAERIRTSSAVKIIEQAKCC